MTAVTAHAFAPDDDGRSRPDADDESLVQFIRANDGQIKKFLQRTCDDPGLVEDAFQEALIVTHAQWHVVKHHEQPLLWVRKTANYKLLNLLRARRLEVVGLDEHAPAPIADPSNQWEAELVLRELLRRLPTRQRAALALAADGCDDDEIARQLGLAVKTVRTYKSAARRKLKELAEGADYEPGTRRRM
jgi:RNA polymerase sigma factor (sigma-70 family)